MDTRRGFLAALIGGMAALLLPFKGKAAPISPKKTKTRVRVHQRVVPDGAVDNFRRWKQACAVTITYQSRDGQWYAESYEMKPEEPQNVNSSVWRWDGTHA